MALGGAANALPEGWKITEFAAPPQGEYPAAISAAANGDVYISSDRNGSLGKDPKFGKIVRATDTDGDGKADEFQDFVPLVNSPRGGHFVGNTLYLIHPPYLSSFRDTDGDGVADEKKTLVKGFGWGIEHPRGADHTTNGVRMGIDGWLYVSVGDFGMPDAVGADGTHLTLWGGGVVRVRPDGSEMEVYSYYVRNICDTAITPTLDLFSRDNTNDGKGWNTRFHHFIPMGDYGYPRLYQKFSNETVVALKDYGGGSGTGALALDEPGFPAEYKNAVFTCDWTTGNIYRHPMKPMEATFEVQ
jgi:glucose/arabinose dehydrogenase